MPFAQRRVKIWNKVIMLLVSLRIASFADNNEDTGFLSLLSYLTSGARNLKSPQGDWTWLGLEADCKKSNTCTAVDVSCQRGELAKW